MIHRQVSSEVTAAPLEAYRPPPRYIRVGEERGEGGVRLALGPPAAMQMGSPSARPVGRPWAAPDEASGGTQGWAWRQMWEGAGVQGGIPVYIATSYPTTLYVWPSISLPIVSIYACMFEHVHTGACTGHDRKGKRVRLCM